MTDLSESVVLCEGYHDRAFWAGLLIHHGCVSALTGQERVTDPWGDTVKGGQYAYSSKSNQFVRITPCNGKEKVRVVAASRLKVRSTHTLARLILNVDADTNADGAPTSSITMSRQSMMDLVRGFDERMAETPDGSLLIDGGATTINLIRWGAGDPPAIGLPNQQTLERLVCASIATAYPDRASQVHQWLKSRTSPPPTSVKEHAWSYMAGWYPEHGCDAFYGLLWQDAPVAEQLETRLRTAGIWEIAEALAK